MSFKKWFKVRQRGLWYTIERCSSFLELQQERTDVQRASVMWLKLGLYVHPYECQIKDIPQHFALSVGATNSHIKWIAIIQPSDNEAMDYCL